jgi:hypothetical protein
VPPRAEATPPLPPAYSADALSFVQHRKKKTNRQKISPRTNTALHSSPIAPSHAGAPPILPDLDEGLGTAAVTAPVPSTQGNLVAPQFLPQGEPRLGTSAALPQSHPSGVVLPKIILDHLDYADAGPHVLHVVARCLQRGLGYEPDNWQSVLQQNGLSDLDVRLLISVMDSMAGYAVDMIQHSHQLV